MRPELPRLQSKQRGFGLVAAMFLIIVFAGAIAAMWRMSVTQSTTSSLALQQARAYQAARAGIEYGIARALGGEACTSPISLDGFEVTVSCTRSEVVAAEEGRTLVFHEIEAVASHAASGSPDHVYRKLNAVVEAP